MKDTCVVEIDRNGTARFYKSANDSQALVSGWPVVLSEKFLGAGVYSIRSVKRPSLKSVEVVVEGIDLPSGIPAVFPLTRYGLCTKFLRDLGVKRLPEGKRKTLHLVVTKRRK